MTFYWTSTDPDPSNQAASTGASHDQPVLSNPQVQDPDNTNRITPDNHQHDIPAPVYYDQGHPISGDAAAGELSPPPSTAPDQAKSMPEVPRNQQLPLLQPPQVLLFPTTPPPSPPLGSFVPFTPTDPPPNQTWYHDPVGSYNGANVNPERRGSPAPVSAHELVTNPEKEIQYPFVQLAPPTPGTIAPSPTYASNLSAPKKKRKRICGLTVVGWVVVGTIVTLVVLVAVLGGVLGGVVFRKTLEEEDDD